MGQPERENYTSPRQAGMELIEATLHFHPTLAEIWTYPAEKLAARISRPMITRHSDEHGSGRHHTTA
jgi:protoporphyrinogen oxidase